MNSAFKERDEDGLIGLKVVQIVPLYHQFMSPVQKTLWDSSVLIAPQWTNVAALRGRYGIHACWPWALNEIVKFDLNRHTCIAEVRGFGDTIQGDLGWRSQKCMLKKVWIPERFMSDQQLRDKYECDFGDLDVWLCEFFLARPFCDEYNLDIHKYMYFICNAIFKVLRPPYLQRLAHAYHGPKSEWVRSNAARRYMEIQSNNLLEDLDLT